MIYRRLIFLILFPVFGFQLSHAQMWEQLAVTPNRLDTADLRALKLELESISFFRDNEIASRQADGYSLPGFWVQPKFTYMPLKQLKIELGLQALVLSLNSRL